LDLATDVPPEHHDQLRRQFAGRHMAVPVAEITYLGFPLWDDRYRRPGVRHALSLALERASLADLVLGHRATPATAMVPPAVPLGRRQAPCRVCQHDAEAARSLLRQSGGVPGRVTVWHEGGPGPSDAARGLAAQLRSVLGLRDVALHPVEPDRYRQALARREPDGPFLLTVPLRYAGPADVLGSAGSGGAAAVTGYRDVELDRLVAEADTAASVEAGALAYRLAENMLLRDLPLVPLWSPHTHLVWSTRIKEVTADPYAGVRLDRIRLVTADG
jgi:oligopeptide transport system substrate-binding protein